MLQTAIIKVMSDAALKVGRMLARDFGEVENLQVSMKGPGDFVTAADHRSEQILVRELSKARPGYNFLVEESGEIKGDNPEFRWIIDPLDGTTNFMHGYPFFCVSIGLEQTFAGGRTDIVAAVTYAPLTNELFCAEKGRGAFLNDKRLQVSKRNLLGESLVATGSFGRKKEGVNSPKAEIIREISNKVASVRVGGSAALELAYLAAGRLDGFWHQPLKAWDMAAGILLVREARGMVSELSGGDAMIKSGSIIASNGHLHDGLRKIIRESQDSVAAKAS
jgi:myo-inositol-1(or 4)-monophosphatase